MNQTSSLQSNKEKPMLLRILSISSMLGSTLLIVAGIFIISTKMFDELPEWQIIQANKNVGIIGIMAGILTLLGALFIWELSRIGFWLYLIGTIVMIVFPILFFWNFSTYLTFAIVYSVIGAIYCYFYGSFYKLYNE
jgi:FtsH-binding integral membrane protein